MSKNNLYLIEEEQPFSQSLIWELQRSFFDSAGIEAWRQGAVPHYVTSNPVVGRTYAEIVFAFLRDLAREQATVEPVYLIELGAGHGRLCYHFLKHMEILIKHSPVKLPPFCYILSDFARSNLSFWKNHPRLQPYFAAGILDYTLFDAVNSSQLQLRHSGLTIKTGDLSQPIIVLGNYFFDTIPQELYYVKNGSINRCLLSLGTETSPVHMHLVELLDKLRLKYDYRLLDCPPYEDAALNAILEDYSRELSDAHVLFPDIGIQCIQRLVGLSRSGLLLLSADKGYHRQEKLEGHPPPSLVTHGSFSLSVNYNAFKKFCVNEGGLPLFPRDLHFSLTLGCLMFFDDAVSYKETLMAYERFVNQFGPDDYYKIKKLVERNFESLNYNDFMGALRLSGYDARLFLQMVPRLFELLPGISPDERLGLFQSLHRMWDMYFPFGEDQDLAFELGRLLMELEFFKEALIYFQLSMKIYGETEKALNAIAMCNGQIEGKPAFLP
jgi:hypothetical protein